MKKLIVGNWKMNGCIQSARSLIAGVVNGIEERGGDILARADVVVCPSFLHIPTVRHALHGYPKIALGAQDCSAFENGAHTGEISAEMLKDSGCAYVILGHSERRHIGGETSATVAKKVAHAVAQDLTPIICVGETEDERSFGQAESVVEDQLTRSIPPLGAFHDIVVAYEPVWAIGTGRVATAADVEVMHGFIREKLGNHVKNPEKVRILYGGSLKPENAAEILAVKNVNGGLVGGASLHVDQFLALASAA